MYTSLLCGCHYLDTVLAGSVQLSLASLGEVAAGACCCYSLGFWKGASTSMDSGIPDHRPLTNFRTALLPLPLCHQTFLHEPEMWLWSLCQLLLPFMGLGVCLSSKGLRPEELTVGSDCIAWLGAWPGSFWRHRRCPKPRLSPAMTSTP